MLDQMIAKAPELAAMLALVVIFIRYITAKDATTKVMMDSLVSVIQVRNILDGQRLELDRTAVETNKQVAAALEESNRLFKRQVPNANP